MADDKRYGQMTGGIAPGSQIDKTIQEGFTGILSGKKKRFSDEVKQRHKTKLFSSIMSRKDAESRGLDQDLIGRGVARGGVMARGRTELRSQALQTYGEGVNELELQSAMAEFDDRMKALGLAQQWLNSRRQYEIGKEQIAAQREATAAQMSLGYARIKSSERIARMSAGAARAGLQLSRERFEFSKQQYEESKITLPTGDRVPPGTFNAMMGYANSGP